MVRHDVYAVGNALVDSEYEVSDERLAAMGVDKRHMTLIDAARRSELLGHVADLAYRRSGGGSAGNTVVAVAQLGGGHFSCRVGNDEHGEFYAHDLRTHGVASNMQPGQLAPGQTGMCMVLVTPDAERSMCTFLGATAELDSSALRVGDIAASKVYYMEGYLAASATGLAAALKGRQVARSAGGLLAATLSDVSMIRFCRPGLEAMLGDGLDYLFCNEEEARTWCGSDDLNQVCAGLSRLAGTVCLTRGAHGCLLLEGERQTEVPTPRVTALDTNGAGDMFAGAFLYAVTHGFGPAQAAWLGNECASMVVAQYGNRLSPQAMAQNKARFLQHLG